MSSNTNDLVFSHIKEIAHKNSQKDNILIEPVMRLMLIIKPKLVEEYRCCSLKPRRWEKNTNDQEWKSIDETDVHSEITNLTKYVQSIITRIYGRHIFRKDASSAEIEQAQIIYHLHPVIAKPDFIDKIVTEFAEIVLCEE